jgi:hypothetical protein
MTVVRIADLALELLPPVLVSGTLLPPVYRAADAPRLTLRPDRRSRSGSQRSSSSTGALLTLRTIAASDRRADGEHRRAGRTATATTARSAARRAARRARGGAGARAACSPSARAIASA